MSLIAPGGCLTPEGLRAVIAAPPGQGPAELVAHLAACERCQTRLLAAGSRNGRAAGPTRSTRLVLLVSVGLLAMLLALVATSLLRG